MDGASRRPGGEAENSEGGCQRPTITAYAKTAMCTGNTTAPMEAGRGLLGGEAKATGGEAKARCRAAGRSSSADGATDESRRCEKRCAH